MAGADPAALEEPLNSSEILGDLIIKKMIKSVVFLHMRTFKVKQFDEVKRNPPDLQMNQKEKKDEWGFFFSQLVLTTHTSCSLF